MSSFSISKQIHFSTGRRTRKVLKEGVAPKKAPGAIPRISRLMALAIRFSEMIRKEQIADQAEIARFGYVSRARVTQIMNLLHLAPDIQEDLLFLPMTSKRRDLVRETHLRPLTTIISWKKQREMWQKLLKIQKGATPLKHKEG